MRRQFDNGSSVWNLLAWFNLVVAVLSVGAEVVAVSRTQADLDSLKAECPGTSTLCLDISDWDKTRSAMETIGDIDLLVNNAGTAQLNPFLQASKEEFDLMMNVNVKAIFNITQVLARKMFARDDGGSGCAIVNISSQASLIALPEHSIYCTTKAA